MINFYDEKKNVYMANMKWKFCIIKPRNFEEIVKNEDWRRAIEKEIDVIEKN